MVSPNSISTGEPVNASMPEQFIHAVVYSQLCHKRRSVSAIATDSKNLLKKTARPKNVLAFMRQARYKGIVHLSGRAVGWQISGEVVIKLRAPLLLSVVHLAKTGCAACTGESQ